MKKLTDIHQQSQHQFAAEIRRRREASGRTWKEIAELCGVHRVTAHKWGSGKAMPSAEHLKMLDRLI